MTHHEPYEVHLFLGGIVRPAANEAHKAFFLSVKTFQHQKWVSYVAGWHQAMHYKVGINSPQNAQVFPKSSRTFLTGT